MITLCCTSELRSDGSCVATPHPRLGMEPRTPVAFAAGTDAELWQQVVALGEIDQAHQRDLIDGLPTRERALLVTVVTSFARRGLMEIDGDFVLDRADAPELPVLRKLHLELTHRCNFRCQACYIGPNLLAASDRRASEGTTEQWVSLIGEAGELGCAHATVTGGEPFLRRDILAILQALTDRGISVEINTNASAITPDIADRLRDLLVEAVEVSVYGRDDESATEYTGNRSAYRSAMRGVRLLADRGILVEAKYFATSTTVDDYDEVRAELGALGVACHLGGQVIHGDIFQGTIPLTVTGVGIRQRAVQQTDLPCYPAVNGLAIEPDGSVRACPKLTVYFGNAFTDGLREIWTRSARLDTFRTFWPEYAHGEGYVRGASHGSLCPASRALADPNGIRRFREQWTQFEQQAST